MNLRFDMDFGDGIQKKFNAGLERFKKFNDEIQKLKNIWKFVFPANAQNWKEKVCEFHY